MKRLILIAVLVLAVAESDAQTNPRMTRYYLTQPMLAKLTERIKRGERAQEEYQKLARYHRLKEAEWDRLDSLHRVEVERLTDIAMEAKTEYETLLMRLKRTERLVPKRKLKRLYRRYEND